MTIVTGMSGSGKTTFCRNHYSMKDWVGLDHWNETLRSYFRNPNPHGCEDELADCRWSLRFVREGGEYVERAKKTNNTVLEFLEWAETLSDHDSLIVDGIWIFMDSVNFKEKHKWYIFPKVSLPFYLYRRKMQSWWGKWNHDIMGTLWFLKDIDFELGFFLRQKRHFVPFLKKIRESNEDITWI